jgi:hypothetical protein
MKVLDLQCARSHVFEGWFASETDFVNQCDLGLVTCPVCADASITKMLSAPRLNLMTRPDTSASTPGSVPGRSADSAAQAAWLALARHVMDHTDDVGEQFAEEARKIHYGEVKSRAIRGQASLEQTVSLLDEGIAVVPLRLPDAFKGPLQ